MQNLTDQIVKRIKEIRKSKKLSQKSCAKILGLTKEAYRGIEDGNTSLTLTQLELLAIYFDVLPTALIDKDLHFQSHPLLQNEDIRPQYQTLREKMIRAMLTIEREEKAVSLDELEQATGIPLNLLQAYDKGEATLPLIDLIKITECLDIPIDALFEPVWIQESSNEKTTLMAEWQPEFADPVTDQATLHDDPYQVFHQAFQTINKADQAQIAKILLEKLRS